MNSNSAASKRLRIAMLVSSFPEISQTFILAQIVGLLERGHHVDIFARRRGDLKKVHPDVTKHDLMSRVVYSPPRPAGILPKILQVVRLWFSASINQPRLAARVFSLAVSGRFRKAVSLLHDSMSFWDQPKRYDIVHCQFGFLGVLGLELMKLRLIEGSLVTSFRGVDMRLDDDVRAEYKELFRDGQLFLPVSDDFRNALIELGCPADRTFVQRSGIDCEKFVPLHDGPRGTGTLEVVSIARFVEKKGLEFGIRAIGNLVQEGFNVRYRIAGHGKLREHLIAIINELNLDQNVELLGTLNQSEVIALLGETDALLVPSITTDDGDREGIPNVLKEALAMEVPIIATDHSGIPEIVQDGRTGWLVPERDTTALATCLKNIQGNRAHARDLARAGRHVIEQLYDNRALNSALVDRYLQCVRTGR